MKNTVHKSKKIICTLEELSDDGKWVHRRWSDGGETIIEVEKDKLGLGFVGKSLSKSK